MIKADKCEKCGSTENLTRDHIIPKWLYKRLNNFGPSLRFSQTFKKNLGQSNFQTLCSECNSKKAGGLDMTHPMTRLIFPWIEELYEQMNKEKMKKE